MPSIYQLKPVFQKLLRPMVAALANLGVTANQVTVAAFILSALGGAAIALWPDRSWPLLSLPGLLFVRMALNAVDGMLAREFGMKSRLGAVLNEMGDVASDATLYLPFALLSGVNGSLVATVVLISVIAEMAGVVAVQIGANRRYDGPFGKSDRAFAFGALGLCLGLGVPAGTWTGILLSVMAALSLLTVFNRTRKALAETPA